MKWHQRKDLELIPALEYKYVQLDTNQPRKTQFNPVQYFLVDYIRESQTKVL